MVLDGSPQRHGASKGLVDDEEEVPSSTTDRNDVRVEDVVDSRATSGVSAAPGGTVVGSAIATAATVPSSSLVPDGLAVGIGVEDSSSSNNKKPPDDGDDPPVENRPNSNETGEDWNTTMLPGAVAIRGPSYRESTGDLEARRDVNNGNGEDNDDDDDDDDSESPSPPPPIQVDSYAVPPSLTDDEIRRMILESTAQVEGVVVPIPEGGGGGDNDEDDDALDALNPDASGKSPSKSRQRFWIAMMAAIVVAAAIVAAIAVPLTAQQRNNQPEPSNNNATGVVDDNLLASVTSAALEAVGGFTGAFHARNTFTPSLDNPVVSSGSAEVIRCGVKTCLENDSNCLVGNFVYEPGCCAGPDCPNSTKCGEDCPVPPDSCYLTDPSNETCLTSECYTCRQENGQDTYVLKDHIWSVDCLQVGTATRSDNQLEYKWAIFCGPVIAGPIVEENRDLGEYQCAATRIGANYSDDDGGLLAAFLPCQFIQLAECGCGPADMYTFGYPAPNRSCVPGDGCPYLCEDAGKPYASELCRHFPGNISWWEGGSAFQTTLFATNVLPPRYELDIYIKGVP